MVDSANRRQVVFTDSNAVDEDITIGQAFTLIDVVVNLSVAASTSENLTINTLRTIGVTEYTCLEAVQNMSLLSAPEATSKVFRFDKKFCNGTKLNVTWANSDSRTATVVISYELDTIGD